MSRRHSLARVRMMRAAVLSASVPPLALGFSLLACQALGGTEPTVAPALATQEESLSYQGQTGAISGQGGAGATARVQEGEDNVWAKCPEGETVDTWLCFDHVLPMSFPPNGSTKIEYNTPHCITLHIGTSSVWGDAEDLRYLITGKSTGRNYELNIRGTITMRPEATGECIKNPDWNKGDYLHIKTRESWGEQKLHITRISFYPSGSGSHTDMEIPGPATVETDLTFKVVSWGVTIITIPYMSGSLVYGLHVGQIPVEPLVPLEETIQAP